MMILCKYNPRELMKKLPQQKPSCIHTVWNGRIRYALVTNPSRRLRRGAARSNPMTACCSPASGSAPRGAPGPGGRRRHKRALADRNPRQCRCSMIASRTRSRRHPGRGAGLDRLATRPGTACAPPGPRMRGPTRTRSGRPPACGCAPLVVLLHICEPARLAGRPTNQPGDVRRWGNRPTVVGWGGCSRRNYWEAVSASVGAAGWTLLLKRRLNCR